MRISIILVGVIVGACALGLGWQAMEQLKDGRRMAGLMQKDIEHAKAELKALQRLPQSPSLSLSDAYALTLNDVRALARAHHLALTVHVDGGEADVEKSAVPSIFQGLRQVRVKVVLTGLARRSQLLALLDGVSSLEKTDPVLVSEVRFKKDAVSVGLVVMGL